MARLPAPRPEPRDLPGQPRQDRRARRARCGQETPALFGKILQDRARLEHADRIAALRRIPIDDRGELVVRSAEHTSELQALMRTSYAGFCLTKKKRAAQITHTRATTQNNH